jgi:thiol-disulfide isomerase/thioredoxin
MKYGIKIVLIMVVCFLLFQDLRVNIAYSLNPQIPDSIQYSSKLLFLNSDYLACLNTSNRQFSLYNMQAERQYKWYVPLPKPPLSSEFASIALLKDKVLILDISQSQILLFKQNGSSAGILQGAATFLENPTAMTVMGEKIYIAQDRFIWVLDELGYLLDVKELPATGALTPWITHMTSDGKELYLCDQANHQIYYGLTTFQRRGSFGSYAGQFQAFSGMAVNGNWVLTDSLQDRVQLFHPAYESWIDLAELIELPSKPVALALNDKTLFVTTVLSDKVSAIPLSKLRHTPSALLSVKEIDLGNNVLASDGASFTVVSSNGFPIQGKVNCSHPGIMIRTPQFKGSINPISFSLIPDKIAMNSSIQTQIQVLLEGGESYAIDLRFSRNDQPGLKLGSSDWIKITDTHPDARLYVYSQNELEGSFELGVKDLSDSFDIVLEQETLDFNSDKTSRIIFSAIAKKNLPSGLYPFQINLRSPELKIQRQYTRYIAYAPSESSTKRTMFSELFTATWCGYCPSAEKALDELDQQYTNDDLLLLSYYLACKDEGSDLLCRPFGQDRASFYKATGTPVFFLDGILRKDGGIANLEDSMFETYDAMVKERIHLRSPLSLNALAMFGSDQNFLKVMVRAELLQNIKNTENLRFFTALSEKEVLFKGKNKNEEHHHVARWMHESQGQRLILKDGNALSKKGQVVELSFAIPSEAMPEGEWQVLVWVQDAESQEILQSSKVSILNSSHEAFTWTHKTASVSWSSGKEQKHSFVLSHFGENIGTYHITPYISGLEEINPAQWSFEINGVEQTNAEKYEVSLMPGQSLEFSILAPPMSQFPDSIGVHAINVLSKEEKSSHLNIFTIKDQASCSVELLYPKHNATVDIASLNLLIKVDSKTKFLAPSSAKYLQGGSVIAVPVALYGGVNHIKLVYECPDGEKKDLVIDINYFIQIQLYIGKLEARHNRKTVQLDAAPFIKESRTMVPLRFIAEAFGAMVTYDAVNKTITIQYRDDELVFVPDSKKVSVNGKIIELDVSPTIVNQRTFLPLRFVSEQFGAQVTWQAETQGISLEVK